MSFTANNGTSAAPAPAPQNSQQPSSDWTYFGTAFGTRGISAQTGSDYFITFIKTAKERLENASKEVDVRLVALDRESFPELHYSAIAVAVQYRSAGQLGVAYHVLLLEATGDELDPLRETFGTHGSRKEVEVLLTASAGMDFKLLEIATGAVANEFPHSQVTQVEGTVVPRSFKPDDHAALQRLLWNAVTACTVELDLARPDFPFVNMGTMKKDGMFNVEMNFGRNQIQDAVGKPMRSDVTVELSIRRKGVDAAARARSIHSAQDEIKIALVNGYVDVLPIRPLNSRSPYQRQEIRRDAPFAAIFVVTDVLNRQMLTPENVLLSISPARALNANTAWANAFRPVHLAADEKLDLTDIGALNIEGNLQNESPCGSMVEARDDFTTADDLGKFIGALVEPNMMVALDVPEAGPQSWYLSVYAAAADGNQEATQTILHAANILTNGHFDKYFKAGERIFATTPTRIHAGTWEDLRGRVRDLRDFDYLAVANSYGVAKFENIGDWTDTFLQTNYPEEMRLDYRLRMLRSLTGETLKVTGYHRRVIFSHPFLDALQNGLADCGVSPRVNSNQDLGDMSNTRGYASFAQEAMLSSAIGYGGNGGYRSAPNSGRGGYQGRWR